MNGDVTVREVMTREFVGVSEADTLLETTELMLAEEVGAVVVLRGSEPVGMFTERDVMRALVDGVDPNAETVADTMQENPATIRPDRPLAAATDVMSAQRTRRLLVMEGDEPVGLLSEHDVVTASMLNPNVDGRGPEAETEAVMAEATATATEAETEDEYSSQGICEVCGSMTRDLSTFNGQLVCNDCKDV